MQNLKILILGHKGYIGSFLFNYLKDNVSVLTIDNRISTSNLDILPQADVIINCIGYTGRPNIDAAENDKTKCYTLNVSLPFYLAQYAYNNKIHLIQLASGCIFSNNSENYKIFSETDYANPQSFYAKTKYSCDLLLENIDYVSIARIRMPIDDNPHDRNLINKLRNYNQIIDELNSMTSLNYLAECISKIIELKSYGIHHISDILSSPASIMNKYKEIVDDKFEFKSISAGELDKLTLARRSNCILGDEITRKKLQLDHNNSSSYKIKNILKNYKNKL